LIGLKSLRDDDDDDGDAVLFENDFNKGTLVSRKDAFKLLFIKYGMGINSFFNLIRFLMRSYIVLALIAIIQMCILYAVNNGNENQDWLNKLTLGGFPYSAPICKRVPVAINRMNIECYGDDTIMKVLDIGILPRFSHPKMK